jgi:hypothetical protein
MGKAKSRRQGPRVPDLAAYFDFLETVCDYCAITRRVGHFAVTIWDYMDIPDYVDDMLLPKLWLSWFIWMTKFMDYICG